MNTYRALHPSFVALHGDEPFEVDLTASEERDALDGGYLELVARPYRVTSDNYTVDGMPVDAGTVITVAFPVQVEAALVGVHLERVVDERPAPKKAAAKKAAAEPSTPKE